MNRKEELQQELDAIQKKEMAAKLQELNSIESSVDAQLRLKEAKSHNFVMKGDFFVKFLAALVISAAFIYIVIQGTMAEMQTGLVGSPASNASVFFQLLSVVGPLQGMILQYFFGTSKASANGE